MFDYVLIAFFGLCLAPYYRATAEVHLMLVCPACVSPFILHLFFISTD